MLRLIKEVPRPVLFILLAIFLFSPLLFSLWEKHNPFYGKWEGEITYYNASDYDKTLDEAIKRWQDSGLPVRFLPVDKANDADLVIYSSEEELKKRCSNCAGHASIGDNILRQARIDLLPPNNPFEEEIIDLSRIRTVIHELGHTLGLKHNQEPCSLMNTESFCSELETVYYDQGRPRVFCGPWQADFKLLGRLYDFRPRPVSPSCQHESKKEVLLFKRSSSMIMPLTSSLDFLRQAFRSKKTKAKRAHIKRALRSLRRAASRSRVKSERSALDLSITSLEELNTSFFSSDFS